MATSRARTFSPSSPSARSTASLARPNALMGALTPLVSPRLFPVRESPMTIEGRSWVTRSPSSIRKRSVSIDAIAFVSS